MPHIIVGVSRKFPTIVSLNNTWRPFLVNIVNKAKATHEACLLAKGMEAQLLYPVINVVQEILKHPIGHTLEVNDVCLPTNPKAVSHNVLYPSNGLFATQKLHTMRTDICEHLAHLSCNIAMTIPCMDKKAAALAVIYLVDLQKVSKNSLNEGRLLEIFQRHRCHINCLTKAKN
jgi:hypothetical protein